MNQNLFESFVEESVNRIKENLNLSKINISFVVKIKEIDKNSCVAIYKGGTIRRGQKAIIWISPNFCQILSEKTGIRESDSDFKYNLERNLDDTIAHELIHGFQDLLGLLSGQGSNFDEDEAESLGLSLSRRESIEDSPLIKEINRLSEQ